MSTHRLCRGLLASVVLIAGCQATKPTSQQTRNGKTPTSAHPGDAANLWNLPDTDGANAAPPPRPTADVLAQRAQEFADTLQPFLARRSGTTQPAGRPANIPGSAASANTPIEPSGVHFNDIAKHPATNPAPAEANVGTPSLASAGQPGNPTVTQTPPRPDVPFNKDSPAVNMPLIVGQPRPLAATDDLTRQFSAQVKDYPQDVAGQFDWQLLQFLQGQSVPQLQPLAPLPGEDREMLTALLDGLSNFRNAVRADNNMLLSRKIRPLLEMADRLRTQAELTVPTLTLCTDVKGFGVYEPIDPARFEAGKEHRTIVYCEVENFASLLDEQKRWETKLTQEVVLYTEQNGLEVWRDKTPARPIIDYSRNRRHDFFIVKMIKLPANLTIGRYLLKVTVVDQQVNRVAENSVPVQIVAQ